MCHAPIKDIKSTRHIYWIIYIFTSSPRGFYKASSTLWFCTYGCDSHRVEVEYINTHISGFIPGAFLDF